MADDECGGMRVPSLPDRVFAAHARADGGSADLCLIPGAETTNHKQQEEIALPAAQLGSGDFRGSAGAWAGIHSRRAADLQTDNPRN